MTKNLGKFLLGVAIVGILVAIGVACFCKYKKKINSPEDSSEEFTDDFEEIFNTQDEDTVTAPEREYVTRPKEPRIAEAAEVDSGNDAVL